MLQVKAVGADFVFHVPEHLKYHTNAHLHIRKGVNLQCTISFVHDSLI